jgi:hypothetical protein
MASRKFTCYVLKFVTVDREPREYYGQTELKRSRTQEEACEVRMQYHLSKPLHCLERGVRSSFEIEALGRPMSKHNVLLQEAINTAAAMKDDASVRGACFSCRVLGSHLRNAAQHISRVCKNLEGQQARDALQAYAAKLDSDHPLSKHLADLPYKDADLVQGVLPTQYAKSRSGKCGSKTRDRQLQQGHYEHGDDRHRVLKRGRDPSLRLFEENARRPVPRTSGRRR